MSTFSHTVTIPRPPNEVFAWLLERDRVPRWTSGVQSYEPSGPLGPGARVRQRLEVSGQTVDVDMEIVRYEPPRAAETRFATNGIDVVNVYTLAPDGAGTRLTQSLDAKARGLTARLLLPAAQPRLERKLADDLERLRGLLAEASGAATSAQREAG
jgi:carbon monoxide dehydrogenase subunit G